jgi:nitrite reductase (cytochrome c-552)
MVFEIQDEIASLLIQNGYAVARLAKLFELAHHSVAAAQVKASDRYAQAKEAYQEAFYRVMFIQNENSTGFHNPPEASRILNDAKQYAASADKHLRQALAASGVQVPKEIDLELEKYLNNRGEKNLQFAAEMEIKDPKANP